jgi:acyl-CoA thioester hydrolase
MGIIYYSRYFEFFEIARTELLKSIGLEVTEIEKAGYFLPVVTAHCEYKKSARFEDEITIRSSIEKQPKPTLQINYEILNSETQELLVKGHTIHAFTDRNNKPVRPPKLVTTKLKLSNSGEEL